MEQDTSHPQLHSPTRWSLVPLGKTPKNPHWKNLSSFAKAKRFVAGGLLLDELLVQNILAWIATYHYVVLLACVLAALVDAMLHVFFSFVFPVLRERYQWAAYSVFPSKQKPVTYYDERGALLFAVSHIGLLSGVIIIGYKVLCAVTDAMIDSCLVVYDERVQCTTGFYGTLIIYRRIFAMRYCPAVLTATVVALVSALSFFFFSNYVVQWDPNSHQGDVFWAFVASFLVIALGTTANYYWTFGARYPTDYEVARWWRKSIPTARRATMYACVLHSIYLGVHKGSRYGIISFSEGMLYVALVHVLFIVAGKAALFLAHLACTFADVSRKPYIRQLYLFGALPFVVLTISTAFVVSPFVAVMHIPPALLFLTSVSRYIRSLEAARRAKAVEHGELQRTADLTPRAKRRVAPHSVLRVALRLYLDHSSTRSSALAANSRVFRSVHRSFITLAFALIFSVGLWACAKHPGLEYRTTTQCSGTPAGDRIRVTARYMVANLYGLDNYTDPSSLVYEPEMDVQGTPRYASLCSQVWGPDLQAGDLAYFSLMPYLQRNSTDFTTMLNFYKRYRHGAADWEAIPTNHTYGRAVFRHLYSPSKNTSVIAVRGTDLTSPFDILQNILLFTETFIFRLLSNVLPFSSLLPEQVVVDFIAACSAASSWMLGDSSSYYYHNHVQEYLKGVHSKYVILTGHSLGGVIAHIVGTRTHRQSIAFSSPGFNWMREKLNLTSAAIDAYTTTVIVSNDFTVTIDAPGGAVHHIQCEHRTSEVCHSIELHTIRMWTVCPQFRAVTRINGTYTLKY